MGSTDPSALPLADFTERLDLGIRPDNGDGERRSRSSLRSLKHLSEDHMGGIPCAQMFDPSIAERRQIDPGK